MTRSLKKSYKELAIPHFKEIFEVIDKVMKENGTSYYLIGAAAITLEMLRLGTKPLRGTKDIDFAVMVSSTETYEKIMGTLLNNGFKKTEDPWRMKHEATDSLVDIMPFGEIEENHTVNFNNSKAELHVLGFREVLGNPSKIEIDEYIADYPGLHGMVILKLVAWSDKPEIRDNDPYDILRIIEYYFDLNADEIYEEHNDLFDADEFDQKKISARVLGRKAGYILNKSANLKERVLKTLVANIADPDKSKIALNWAVKHDYPIEYSVNLLDELRTGILETIEQD